MPLTDRGLLARYFVDEAASGTTPTQLEDASGVGTAVPLPITYGTNLSYAEVGGNRGLNSANTTGAGRAEVTVGTTKLANLNGITAAVFEYVVDGQGFNTSNSRVGVINNAAGSNPQLGLAASAAAEWKVFVNQSQVGIYNIGTGRCVVHVVIDTTLATAADRVKVFKDGVLLAATSYVAPTQNATFSVGSTDYFVLLNRNNGTGTYDRALQGTIYYVALYTVAFTDAEVDDNVAILSADDDTGAGSTTGETWYPTASAASGVAHGALSATAPASSTSATGWTVGTTAADNYARMAFGVERAAATFGATVQPSSGPDNALGDCFRTPAAQTGDYEAGNWTFAFPVRADTLGSGQDGRVRVRLWRSANADGSGATEITAGAVELTNVTDIATGADSTSSGSVALGAVSLANEYVFVQLAWRVTGTTSSAAETPTFVNKGTFTSGTAGLSVPVPSGIAQNDLLILVVESANQAIATPSGWTQVTNSPQFTGTAAAAGGVRLAVFYKIAGASEGSVTVADTGDHTVAQIFAWRGVDTTTPIPQSAGAVDASATASLSCPAVTTTRNNCVIVNAIALDKDLNDTDTLSAHANASLTTLTEHHDQTVASGVGGGIAVLSGVKATAGASGNTTATGDTSTTHAYLTFAIQPPAVDNTTADVLLRLGSNAKITTPAFTAPPPPFDFHDRAIDFGVLSSTFGLGVL